MNATHVRCKCCLLAPEYGTLSPRPSPTSGARAQRRITWEAQQVAHLCRMCPSLMLKVRLSPMRPPSALELQQQTTTAQHSSR